MEAEVCDVVIYFHKLTSMMVNNVRSPTCGTGGPCDVVVHKLTELHQQAARLGRCLLQKIKPTSQIGT